MNIKISSTGGLLLGDATNGYKEIASKEYVDTKTTSITWGDITGKPSTFAPAEHTHASLKNGNYTASLPSMSANGTIALASQIPAAQVNANWNETSSSSKAYIQNKPTLGTAAAKNIGTGASDVAAGNHTHSDYVSKSDTNKQTLSSSLSLPSNKDITVGSTASGSSNEIAGLYAASGDSYVWVGNQDVQSWLQKDRIGYTTDGSTITELLFPTASGTSKTLATTADIPTVGTAAAKDVPSSGNASNAQVVMGNDTRLSNARTPTTHKSTHATGGSDALTPADIGASASSHVHASLSDGTHTASIPTLTADKTLALSDHTHSDYVSKSDTNGQSIASNLTLANGKDLYVGAGTNNTGHIEICSTNNGTTPPDIFIMRGDETEYLDINSHEISYSSDGSNETVLTFPPVAKSGVIATEYDIRKRTRVLYESVIGNSSTPASAITISEDYNIYHFWIGANGTFPTFTFSFPNFESIPARFPFTLIAHVNSGATTLTGPSGWAWTSGAGLPTSGFAGKVLWISGLKKTNDSTEVPLVSCWRCA